MAAVASPPALRPLYEQMVLGRVFETEAERQYKAARIGGYCHLSSGQEAATVGVVHTMQEADQLVTGYRCHGFALARGVAPEAVMAELFGKADGICGGRGGTMHLYDRSVGLFGTNGIVAAGIGHAVGIGITRRGERGIEELLVRVGRRVPLHAADEGEASVQCQAIQLACVAANLLRLLETAGVPQACRSIHTRRSDGASESREAACGSSCRGPYSRTTFSSCSGANAARQRRRQFLAGVLMHPASAGCPIERMSHNATARRGR